MFTIDNDMTINVTRGDCGKIDVSATVDGAVYVFSPGDILRLKVFEKKNCENVVLKKDFGIEVNATTVTLTLTGKDTKFGGLINKPTNYWYEIELNPETNPQTIVGYDDDGPKLFCLHPEGNEVEETEPDETDVGAFDDKLDLTSKKALPNWLIAQEIFALQGKVKQNETGKISVTAFGAVGDGKTDDREAVEQAFAALTDNSTLVFPKGHYIISSFPDDFDGSYDSLSEGNRYWFFQVEGKKNITIDINDSIIELRVPPTHNEKGFCRYLIFSFRDCENFIIKNGTLIGDRKTHDYTKLDKNNEGPSHEWGNGVAVRVTDYNTNTCSGLIENLTISECIGDGISLYNGSMYGPVTVKNCEVFNCRRQGITVGDTNNITIDGCYIHHIGTHYKDLGDETSGFVKGSTQAGCGIDIEAEGTIKKAGVVNILNTKIEETTRYSLCAAYNDKEGKRNTTEAINIFNCELSGVVCLSSYFDYVNKIVTPVSVINSVITHGKFYEEPQDRIDNNFLHRQHIFDNTQIFNCVFNSYNDDDFYKNTTNFSIIGDDKEKEKKLTIENSVFNLTENAKLRDTKLNNCRVNGGAIHSYEGSNSAIRDCNNVLFNGCRFKVVSAQKIYTFTHCTFKNCVDDASSGNGLKFRQCYFDTRFLPNGTYIGCTIEDEIEV